MKRAAGLMIQRMPIPDENCSETSEFALASYDENCCNSVSLMNSITTEELIDSKQEAYQIIYRHYHKTGIQLHTTKLLKFQCQCSHEKIEKTIASFPLKEIDDLKTINGSITVDCEFCSTQYKFNSKMYDALE